MAQRSHCFLPDLCACHPAAALLLDVYSGGVCPCIYSNPRKYRIKSSASEREIQRQTASTCPGTPSAAFLVFHVLLHSLCCNIFLDCYRYIHGVTLILAGAVVLAQVSYAKKNRIFDEFARENLKTTDSICLKVSFGLMTVATLACVFAEFDGIVAGYFVVGGILLLAELVSARRETIVHLENGRYNPSLKLAMDIAKVFHVTVEDLFEFVDEEP